MDVLIPLVVAGIPLLVIAGVMFAVRRWERNLARSSWQNSEELRERMQRAIWAGATILSMQNEGSYAMQSTGKTRVRLWLDVNPPQGKPYEVSVSWQVDIAILPQLHSGQTVSIKIDRDDPQKIYPNMSGIEP